MCITPTLYYFSIKNGMKRVGINKIKLRTTHNLFTFYFNILFSGRIYFFHYDIDSVLNFIVGL
jgi:hypothetical protein